jgi:hypothetical protein
MTSREKIQFYRDTLVKDGAGGNTFTEVLIWSPPSASVREVSVSLDFIASQPNLKTLFEIKCRYNPEVAIVIGDKIKWRGFTLVILRPIPDRVNRQMKITAYAEVETSNRGV